jgi:tetratricopeptide (TPR) repeat protein
MQVKSDYIVRGYIDRLEKRLTNTSAVNRESESGIAQFRLLLSELHDDRKKKHVDCGDSNDNESLVTIDNHIQLALETFRKIRGNRFTDRQNLDFLYLLSETYFTLGNLESAVKYFREASELALGTGDPALRGRILTRIAVICVQTGEWQSALVLLSEAIELLQGSGRLPELAQAQIEYAKLLHRSGNYNKAAAVYQDALSASESVNDLHSRAVVLNGLGVIRRMQGHLGKALHYFQSAFVEFQKLQDEFGIADCLANIGTVHMQQDRLKDAKNYFDKAHKLAQSNGYNQLLAFIYLNKSEYFLKVADPHFAISAGIAALRRFVIMGNPMGISKANLVFARTFHQLCSEELAISFFAESIRIYRRLQISLGLANCYSELNKLFTDTGDRRRAELCLSKYRALMSDLKLERVIAVSSLQKNPDPENKEKQH